MSCCGKEPFRNDREEPTSAPIERRAAIMMTARDDAAPNRGFAHSRRQTSRRRVQRRRRVAARLSEKTEQSMGVVVSETTSDTSTPWTESPRIRGTIRPSSPPISRIGDEHGDQREADRSTVKPTSRAPRSAASTHAACRPRYGAGCFPERRSRRRRRSPSRSSAPSATNCPGYSRAR